MSSWDKRLDSGVFGLNFSALLFQALEASLVPKRCRISGSLLGFLLRRFDMYSNLSSNAANRFLIILFLARVTTLASFGHG